MTFTCSLTTPRIIVPPEEGVAISGAHDFRSLVMHACALLSKTDCQFHVGGFGQDDWPVDVGYDLPTVIEQLPDLIADIRARAEAELDFYGQGVERKLVFAPGDDMMEIRCYSGTSWNPNPEIERTSFTDIELMFMKLADDFVASLELVDPRMTGLSPFATWRIS